MLATPILLSQPYPHWKSAALPQAPIQTQASTWNVTQTNKPVSVSTLPPPVQDPALRFAVIGDAGTGDQNQAAVASQLARWHQSMPFNSVMVLGDNVYQDGEPELFQDRIGKPYQELFKQGVHFNPVLGNHDIKQGYDNWQLNYWGVPRFYHYKLGPKGSDVEFWAIDTNLLTPGLEKKEQKHAPDSNNPYGSQQMAQSELDWLKQTLAQSTASMKVVYGHHPMYSTGAATKPIRAWQQSMLVQTLAPILQQYNVDLYMSGHEHHYEHPVSVNGLYHLVSGAGGKLDTAKRGGPEGKGLIKQLHFMLFDITSQGLVYRTVGANGTLLDSGLIPRKGQIGQRLSLNA